METLPGRGYRFIGPVQRSPKPVLEITQARADASPSSQTRAWLPWAACGALAVVGLGGYWLGSRGGRPVESLQPVRFQVTPPPGFALEGAASRQSFALSPDGTRLAFTAMNDSGALSVFVRDIDALEPRRIPDSDGAHTVFWPPDGRSLFLTVRGKLRRAWLDGKPPVILSDSPPFMFSGAWLSPNAMLLSGRLAASILPPSGGTLQPVATQYPWPQMLPDGKLLLYAGWNTRTGRHVARIARFGDPGSAKDLIEADSRAMYTASVVTPGAGYLVFVRGGSLLAQPFDVRSLRVTGEAMPVVNKLYSFFPTGAADFSVAGRGSLAYLGFTGRSQLAWVDRQGRQVTAIGPAGTNVKSGRLSPNGRWVAAAIYDVERGSQNLWLFDSEKGAGRQLTPAAGVRDAPVWSPDSTSLAYMYSTGDKPPGIQVRGVGEEESEQSLAPAGFQMPTDWSPGGRFLLYINTGVPRFAQDTQSDIWLADMMARDRKPIPLLKTQFHEANAMFSPDGKWIAFTSNESGRSELYIQAFESGDSPRMAGERFLVSRSGAQAVRWRRDGKELFYLAFDGRIHAVPVTLSAKPVLGAPQALFAIGTEARAAIHSILGFDVSPDGRRFLIPVVAAGEGPSLVVVRNWETALPRKP